MELFIILQKRLFKQIILALQIFLVFLFLIRTLKKYTHIKTLIMKINSEFLENFISKDELVAYEKSAIEKNNDLHTEKGLGNEFLGWVDLPSEITHNIITDIEDTAAKISKNIDIMVVVGIGGSYLGSKAIIEALSNNFSHLKKDKTSPIVLFAGQNLSEDYLTELRAILSENSYAITVISKSGTTTEPAVAFRILKKDMEEKYGKEEAKNRIFAVTDKVRGALKELSTSENYKTYEIADNIGGRYSVLTPVGLLPIAVAGFDIRKLVEGAINMYKRTDKDIPFNENPATIYAAYRNILYNKNFDIEILVNYNPKLHFFTEWWKQLYGESEGKNNKGIFPAGVDFTSDLHSMGQYIQEGRRNLFETVIRIGSPNSSLQLPKDEKNLDGLNYLAGKGIDEINKNAELGTILAHTEGGVPNIIIEIPKLNEYYLGELIYFFEKACGVSGYLLGVNPFDQPGVEAYKKNMFALLGKKGFEEERAKLLKS